MDLSKIMLVGRTFEEYCGYFGLREQELHQEEILDVAAGVSSFCAEASQKKIAVIAADPIYREQQNWIEKRCVEDLSLTIAALTKSREEFVWTFFKDVKHLKQGREAAYRTFLADYRLEGAERYIPAALPTLPFASKQFSTTLCSALLFLYDDRLDYEFHRDALFEMMRVTRKEIRIWPLTTLQGNQSPLLGRIMADPLFDHWKFEKHRSTIEFFKGAIEYLKIKPQ